MQDINKLIEKKKQEYKEKRENLNQAQQMVNRLQTECINLEGQIQSLEELNQPKENGK